MMRLYKDKTTTITLLHLVPTSMCSEGGTGEMDKQACPGLPGKTDVMGYLEEMVVMDLQEKMAMTDLLEKMASMGPQEKMAVMGLPGKMHVAVAKAEEPREI
jgi:hypothetical protein